MNGKAFSYIGGLLPGFKMFHYYRFILINLQIFLCQGATSPIFRPQSWLGLQFDLILTA